MAYRLAVDLGTCFTAAAVYDHAAPRMVGLGNRAMQVPSVLYLQHDPATHPGASTDGFLVGEAAELRGQSEPDRLVREFKRRLGDPVPILVAGSPFSAEALMARLLRWVVDRVTEQVGEKPAELVLTHPASWGPYKLDVLGQVVTLADVASVRFCPEPLAAAAQYAARSRTAIGSRVVVYDLGGGTFDVCVVEKTPDGFRTLGEPGGVTDSGGSNFDYALFQFVASSLGEAITNLDPNDPVQAMGLARLRRDCVEVKEALSSDVDTVVPVSLPGLGAVTRRITRRDFEELIRPSLEDTFAATNRAISSAGIQASDLQAIIMVGGSSRIPLVGELLQQRFHVPTAMDTHPKHDVVLGAVGLYRTRDPVAEAALPAVPGQPSTLSVTPIKPPLAPASITPPAETSSHSKSTDAAGSPPPLGENEAVPATQIHQAPASQNRKLPHALALAVAGLAVGAGMAVGFAIQARESGQSTAPPAYHQTAAPTAPMSPTSSTSPTPRSTSPSSTPLPSLPKSVSLTKSQMIVAMQTGGNWDLYLADESANAPQRRLTKSRATDYGQMLSPDRRTVIYIHDIDITDNRRTLRVAGAADGKGDRELFSPVPQVCNAKMYRPALSPTDPGLLAVPCTNTQGHWGLYLIRTDGKVVREIDQPGRAVDDPTFSPDGKELAFWSGTDVSGGNIYVTRVDKPSTPRRLTKSQLAGQDADPTYSPNGDSIAFRRRTVNGTTGGNADIYVMRADGKGAARRLTNDPDTEQDPSYSPSGKRIAFQSDKWTPFWPNATRPRAWTMNNDGSNQRLLWTQKAVDRQATPAWSGR